MNKGSGTNLAYYMSKDRNKLVEFIALLPFKIEIKSINYENKKHVCYFNLPDGMDYPQVKLKNLDLDEVY